MNARRLACVAGEALFVALWLMTSHPAFAGDDASLRYSHKMSFRFDGGLMKNVGTAGGTGGIASGINVLALYYPRAAYALGAGYHTTFDWAKETVPVSGFFAVGRWYFHGEGTRIATNVSHMSMKRQDSYSAYTGLAVGQSAYYLGESAKRLTDQLTGHYFNINALVGVEIRVSESFEFNIEGSQGLLVFAATDEKFRIKGTILSFGLSYLW